MQTILNLHGIFANLSRVSELIQIGDHTLTIYYDAEKTSLKNVKFICKFFRFDPVPDGDIQIEIDSPVKFPFDPDRKYETSSDVAKRVENAKKIEVATADFDKASLRLFATAYERLKLPLPDIDIIRNVSLTIAKSCLSTAIKVEHLAEAIQYRSIEADSEKLTKYLIEL